MRSETFCRYPNCPIRKRIHGIGNGFVDGVPLRDNLQALLGENHQLSAVVGFQYPNVKALAEYLIGQLFSMPNQPLNLSQKQDSDRVPTPLVSDNLIPKSLTENHSETNGLLQIATSMRSSGPSTDDLDNMSEQEIDYWLSPTGDFAGGATGVAAGQLTTGLKTPRIRLEHNR